MISIVCPVCKEECEHTVLRETGDLVVQCCECGHVHRMERPVEPATITIRTIVSYETESKVCSVEAFEDETVSIGDRLAAECGDEVFGVEVTGIEVGAKRVRSAVARDVTTLWTRKIDQVVVRASIHTGRTTIPLYQTMDGEEELVVGETRSFAGRHIRISHIKLRDGPLMRKEGWKTVARRVKRVYGYLDGRSRINDTSAPGKRAESR
ncbi:HVO_0476 family zinc finger protein [Methanoculleus sp.]|uniref:HVO_0476 family zinc finger protein n=1 Tax=Methanoculleus sp. TaxID=90427 RepID=UPI002609DFF4|nr:HVO_0476 family zinc finger protein [Methanoculleus sp.]MDI6866361.1 HVO_0476 family zinc finger protein [Methanoculleus sp.]